MDDGDLYARLDGDLYARLVSPTKPDQAVCGFASMRLFAWSEGLLAYSHFAYSRRVRTDPHKRTALRAAQVVCLAALALLFPFDLSKCCVQAEMGLPTNLQFNCRIPSCDHTPFRRGRKLGIRASFP